MGGSGDFETFLETIGSPTLRAVAHHWHQARGERTMPGWADLQSSVLSPHFKMLWGFHHDSRTGDFTGRLAGKHVMDWLGANFWGASLKDLHPPHVFRDAHYFLSRVVTVPAAGRCTGRLFSAGGMSVTGERIALPLALDGMTGDGILGASDYDAVPLSGQIELIHENMEWYGIKPA